MINLMFNELLKSSTIYNTKCKILYSILPSKDDHEGYAIHSMFQVNILEFNVITVLDEKH